MKWYINRVADRALAAIGTGEPVASSLGAASPLAVDLAGDRQVLEAIGQRAGDHSGCLGPFPCEVAAPRSVDRESVGNGARQDLGVDGVFRGLLHHLPNGVTLWPVKVEPVFSELLVQPV
jgi:hypothetical protein